MFGAAGELKRLVEKAIKPRRPSLKRAKFRKCLKLRKTRLDELEDEGKGKGAGRVVRNENRSRK